MSSSHAIVEPGRENDNDIICEGRGYNHHTCSVPPRDVKGTVDTMDVISIIKDNRKAIHRRFGVKRIGVFGSYARGEGREASDIDVLVEFREPTFKHFMGLVFYLEELLGRPVDLVTVKALSPYIAPMVKKEVVWCE